MIICQNRRQLKLIMIFCCNLYCPKARVKSVTRDLYLISLNENLFH